MLAPRRVGCRVLTPSPSVDLSAGLDDLCLVVKLAVRRWSGPGGCDGERAERSDQVQPAAHQPQLTQSASVLVMPRDKAMAGFSTALRSPDVVTVGCRPYRDPYWDPYWPGGK